MKTVSADQMREIERVAIEEMGIPSILLMENAAIGVCEECLGALETVDDKRIAVVCGTGNNGGDGFAAARLLHAKGISVQVVLLGKEESIKNDALVNYEILQNMDIPIIYDLEQETAVVEIVKNADIVVDAIFGTGLTRNVEGVYARVIGLINGFAKYVVAVDIPSGVHSDNGQILGSAVLADKTVTFGCYKHGHFLLPGRGSVGTLVLKDIMLGSDMIDRVDVATEVLFDSEIKQLLPERPEQSHKNSFGRVYVFAGCDNMTGAAVMSATAAYTVGCGLVRVLSTRLVTNAISLHLREAIVTTLPDMEGSLGAEAFAASAEEIADASVVLVGPGLSHNENTSSFVRALIAEAEKPMVIDADGLNAVAEDADILKILKASAVITPHIGEMSRLIKVGAAKILENPMRYAVDFAREYGVVVVLKCAATIVAAPDGRIYMNQTGNNALAKAGTGDILAGMISGFAAQGIDLFRAARLGVYIHGRAGEIASEDKTLYGVLAGDLVKYIPRALQKILRS